VQHSDGTRFVDVIKRRQPRLEQLRSVVCPAQPQERPRAKEENLRQQTIGFGQVIE
jgi:hypothetical protein